MAYQAPTPAEITQRANAIIYEAELQEAARAKIRQEAQHQHELYKKENPWWKRHPLLALSAALILGTFLYEVFLGEPESASMSDKCMEAADAGWTDPAGCALLD